jgi:hypothetical protein
MEHIKNINEWISGPGGSLGSDPTPEESFNYKIAELSWIKERFDLYRDKISANFISENMGEMGECINKLHEIVNKLR